jgi:ribose transport system ATP-binding protein
MTADVVLELEGIEKSFPGVKALEQMHLKLRRGSVHALLGENGAGKSTLMKILSGVYKRDAGRILLDGEPVEFENTLAAQQAGVAIIHQELNLCWNLTVADNILLGREKVGKLGYYKQRENTEVVQKLLERLGVSHIDPLEKVNELSIANQQMVEIAKAISVDAKILILDEPTSSLTEKETTTLFRIMKTLQRQGVSMVYISHKLSEIFGVCDEVTVIRDGKWIESFPIEEASRERIIELMVGRPIDMVFPEPISKPDPSRVVLKVESLHKHGLVSDIGFEVRAGEILGVAGLVGAGRTEMAKTVFGRFQKDEGQVLLDGKVLEISSPATAIRNGVALVTEDRKAEGLFLGLSVKDNIASSNLDMVSDRFGFVDSRQERSVAKKGVEKLNVRTPSITTTVRNLSGGNQQKLIVSRWLAKEIKVLILDEPTRGIDVGAKRSIYEIMRNLAAQGIAIVMISSELPEILGMSDRVAVMCQGRIVKILDREEASQETIMTYATGGAN